MRSYWLKHYREEAGLSQSELAERSMLDEYTIQRYERSSPAYPSGLGVADKELRICCVLGTRREELEYGPGGYEGQLRRQQEAWDEAMEYFGIKL